MSDGTSQDTSTGQGEDTAAMAQERPNMLIGLGIVGIAGCVIFSLSILIADFVVPDHDWIADTISDLGAGRYEFIVDIGIYAYSASLIALAVNAAHAHLGKTGWSYGICGLIATGLIVFLVGARNEYGDNDSDGVVIHVYLVYALGFFFATVPWAMSGGAYRAGRWYGRACRWMSILWIFAAPVFFFLPTGIDGVYERFLGLITFVYVCAMSWLFITRGRLKRGDATERDSWQIANRSEA